MKTPASPLVSDWRCGTLRLSAEVPFRSAAPPPGAVRWCWTRTAFRETNLNFPAQDAAETAFIERMFLDQIRCFSGATTEIPELRV